jgi:N-acetylglucosamine kinase
MIPCFDIGGSEIRAALADPDGGLAPLGRRPTPRGDLEAFVAAIAGFLRAGGTPATTPAAIAIAGVVDPETGRLTCANIPCVDGLRLASELSSRLGRPVAVHNDADCFAVAQALRGHGRGRRVVFGAILGSGVGGGLVVDGALVRGAGGYAGEWGHGPALATEVDLEPGAPPLRLPRFPCGCGLAGCVDTVGGARGIERLHAHLGGDRLDSRAIVDGWRAGAPGPARTVAIWAKLVAPPLALVVNTVGADIVPVGGGLGSNPALVALLDREVRPLTLR